MTKQSSSCRPCWRPHRCRSRCSWPVDPATPLSALKRASPVASMTGIRARKGHKGKEGGHDLLLCLSVACSTSCRCTCSCQPQRPSIHPQGFEVREGCVSDVPSKLLQGVLLHGILPISLSSTLSLAAKRTFVCSPSLRGARKRRGCQRGHRCRRDRQCQGEEAAENVKEAAAKEIAAAVLKRPPMAKRPSTTKRPPPML